MEDLIVASDTVLLLLFAKCVALNHVLLIMRFLAPSHFTYLFFFMANAMQMHVSKEKILYPTVAV